MFIKIKNLQCKAKQHALFLALTFLLPCFAQAATDVEISSQPLELGLGPLPNVLILTDDSKSMDWEIVYTELDGDGNRPDNSLIFPGNRNGWWNGSSWDVTPGTYYYGYLYSFGNYSGHPTTSNDGHVVPTPEFIATKFTGDCDDLSQPGCHEIYHELIALWKLRSHEYNKLYYNPNKQYEPWPGYAEYSPQASPIDPTDPTGTKVDLTTVKEHTSPRLNFTSPKNHWEWDIDHYVDNANSMRLAIYYTSDGSGGYVRHDITGSAADAEQAQNFANWFTYYRRRMYTAQTALAKVVEESEGLNLGYSTINSQNQVSVAANSKADIMTKIFDTESTGKTPLRTALYKAGRYFQCAGTDTLMSDCPIPAVGSGAACQPNYTILMTDGFFDHGTNDPFYSSAPSATVSGFRSTDHDSLGNNDSPFDDGPFMDDSSGSGTQTLADIAMYFYKTDLNAADDRVPATGKDKFRIAPADASHWNSTSEMHQHMKTYTVGFGVFGSMTGFPDVTDVEPWPTVVLGYRDPSKIDDLMHAAYNGRGEYYSASNADELATNLKSALVSIKNTTGAASSISFNTQEIEAGTLVFRAKYNSANNSGDISAYQYNNGTVAASPEWEASSKLATQLSAARPADCSGDGSQNDNRVMLTYNTTTNAGLEFDGALFGILTAAEVDWFRGHNYGERACSGGTFRNRNNTEIIGDIAHSRPIHVGAPSMPRRDNYPYPTGANNSYSKFVTDYANNAARENTVLVGANDGMFHAFYADGTNKGKEIFAYVPRVLINENDADNNSIKRLLDPEYTHNYYVDLPPAINDAFIDLTPASGSNDEQWRTVVIGGLRAGGRGYFALDVTETDDFATEASGKSNVLWEFTNAQSSQLGLTFSPPVITMSNLKKANGQNRWFAIFGNGYNSDDGVARLFMVDVERGIGGWNVNSGTDDFYILTPALADAGPASATAAKNGLSTPRAVDIDENGTVDYVYAGDLRGNLYRFDLTSSTVGTYKSNTDSISKVIFRGDATRPITTQPLAFEHPEDPGSLILVATSGSWFMPDDGVDIATNQSIYGVWDKLEATPANVATTAAMIKRNLLNVAVTDGGTTTTHRVFESDSAIPWYTTGTPSTSNALGWYLTFDMAAADDAGGATEYPGEKAIRNMVTMDGYVFVNTVIPSTQRSCDATLKGSTLAFNPQTGSLRQTLFTSVGEIGNDNLPSAGTVLDDIPSNPVLLPSSDVPGGAKLITEVGGTLMGDDINSGVAGRTGRMAWRQIE